MASPTEISELVNVITADVRTLISDEIALVKAEIKPSVRKVGVGSGMFAGALYFVISATIILWFVMAAGFTWLYAAHTPASNWGALFFGTLTAFVLILIIAILFVIFGVKNFSSIRGPQKSPESVGKSFTALAQGLEDGGRLVQAEVGHKAKKPTRREKARRELELIDDVYDELDTQLGDVVF
ncbi:MAG: phage holin family protein [Propionibacteriaceae bacterium]|nr:phage holin family protein [Propionibacteriaceae bacterium]